MLTYFIALLSVPALCVAWFLLQEWLNKVDTAYKGYQAGCGGCTRRCDKKKSI